jgi:hypothetical protein
MKAKTRLAAGLHMHQLRQSDQIPFVPVDQIAVPFVR